MAANIEIEAKVLISEKDYYNIVERFEDKIIKEYEQSLSKNKTQSAMSTS